MSSSACDRLTLYRKSPRCAASTLARSLSAALGFALLFGCDAVTLDGDDGDLRQVVAAAMQSERQAMRQRLASSLKEKRRYAERMLRQVALAREARRRGLDRQPEVRQRVRRVLSAALMRDVRRNVGKVSDDEVRARYRRDHKRYDRPQMARARILVTQTQQEAKRLRASILRELGKVGGSADAASSAAATRRSSRNGAKRSGVKASSSPGKGGPAGTAQRRRPERAPVRTVRVFRDMALQHSADAVTKHVGGDLGFFARGEKKVPEAINDAAFSLDVGEISEPVAYKKRWALVLRTARRPARRRPFARVAPSIRFRLLEEKRRKAVKDLVERLEQQLGTLDDEALGSIEIKTGPDEGSGKTAAR